MAQYQQQQTLHYWYHIRSDFLRVANYNMNLIRLKQIFFQMKGYTLFYRIFLIFTSENVCKELLHSFISKLNSYNNNQSNQNQNNTNNSTNPKPHQKGPRGAPDVPDSACSQHWKHARNATYCSDPLNCGWVHIIAPRQT